MAIKQPPIGQIQGRGRRIKATEEHFGMQCLDVNGAVGAPHTGTSQLLVSGVPLTMAEYTDRFDGVQDNGPNW